MAHLSRMKSYKNSKKAGCAYIYSKLTRAGFNKFRPFQVIHKVIYKQLNSALLCYALVR